MIMRSWWNCWIIQMFLAILLSEFNEETGRVSDKTILLSGLYEKQGRVSDKPILL